jgi:lysophospholipase L1-like esterase
MAHRRRRPLSRPLPLLDGRNPLAASRISPAEPLGAAPGADLGIRSADVSISRGGRMERNTDRPDGPRSSRGLTRRTGLLALGTIALTGACAEPSTPTRPAATPEPAHVRLLITGDSITQQSAGDFTWRYRLATHLYQTAPGQVTFVGDRDDIWDNVTDKGGSYAYVNPHFDRRHHARWGDSLREETPTIESVVRAQPADVMLVALGANDLSYWTTPPDTAVLMKRYIDNVRVANPRMTFVIGHVLARADFRDFSFNLPQAGVFNQILDAQAPGWSTPTSKVVVARTDLGWDPRVHAWDGSHPTPDGEMFIARGFADALAGLDIGARFGPVPAHVPWPGPGDKPTVTPAARGGGRVTLTWAATPGATQYLVERRVVSWNEPGYTRQPGAVSGYTWTSDPLLPGITVAYRVVPWKGRMDGTPSPAVMFTTGEVD